MSIVMSVIFRGKLPDRKSLSRTMVELGFPFTIAASVGSLERHSGYMPMWLRREETGVEFDVETDRERAEIAEMEGLAGKKVDPTSDRVANFRWGGDEREMLAGMCGAAALAKLVNGVVFDDQESRLLSADEAIASARQHLQSVPKWYRSELRGTRPADIRHYLKPLLKQRSDLVLVGRLLVIRPVRHLMRGAYLARSTDKYSFRMFSNLHQLCSARGSIEGPLTDGTPSWQPYFEPLLMDVLAEDIFKHIGQIVSLEDYAAVLPESTRFKERAVALALSRGPEHGIDYVNDVERRHPDDRVWKPLYPFLRELFQKDIDELCATFHAEEARVVKALKLERVWEPSPFPIEVPAAERKHRCNEPLFHPEPWIARPSGLIQVMPEHPGDICFAKERLIFRERDNPLPIGQLTREQAEERHRNAEDYVLATRLLDGVGVLLERQGKDRNDPDRVKYQLDPAIYASGYRIELYGKQLVTQAEFSRNRDAGGILELSSINVRERATRRSIWSWGAYRHSNEISIYDYRSGKEARTTRPLTDADWDQARIPMPEFGEVDAFVQVVRSLARSEGYGEIS
jgi:hypothetical protein